MKKIPLLVLILIIALLSPQLTEQAAAEKPQAARPERNEGKPQFLKIGLVAPLSGDRKWIGERILKGVQHAIAARAASGPDLKPEVRLSIEDSRGDPTAAASAITKLGKDRQVIAIIGPALSEEVVKASQSVTSSHIPTISPTAVAPGIAGLSPYLFRNSMTLEMEVTQLTDYATRKMGLTSFSILHPLNPKGQEMRDIFQKLLGKRSGQIVYSLSYHPAETDFKDLLVHIGGMPDQEVPSPQPEAAETPRRQPPLKYQAIFIPGDAPSSTLILRALQYYNITGVTLLGSDEWNSSELISQAKGYAEGAVFVDGFFASSSWPHVADFVKSYRTSLGEEPDIISAQAYDAASILLQFIGAGLQEREAIKEALLRLKRYPGVSGYTTFLPSGEAEKELFILTVKNGQIVQLN